MKMKMEITLNLGGGRKEGWAIHWTEFICISIIRIILDSDQLSTIHRILKLLPRNQNLVT